MAQIFLNQKKINKAKALGANIAQNIHDYIKDYTTDSVERSVLRLYGVDDADDEKTPLCNKIVDILKKEKLINSGVSKYFAAAMLKTDSHANKTAEMIINNKIDLKKVLSMQSLEKISEKEQTLAQDAVSVLDRSKKVKNAKKAGFPLCEKPYRYVIVATGNIYEDCTQAESAVYSGADIIAVIRSTAQSLLDYIPSGATTTGFGGTYATQKNFSIMRSALDKISKQQKRYIRLVNYASGLCMPEIAVCSAFEDLDILLNDSMYGILFRDINMKRTFIDQHFSRLICTRADIMINTGEDNYLTTSDAVEKAHSVTASQIINEAMAKQALLPDDLLGLGHAFEIDPEMENGFLYELAHAMLAKKLFPNAPLKYMPPTKHKSRDIFFSICMDTMFNLASIATNQGIHLAGMPTEAVHTPSMSERHQALNSVNYVFNTAKNLCDEIEFKKDGIISKRAKQVLDSTIDLLEKINKSGLMSAISQGWFAQIKREPDKGKGFDGVIKKSENYSNPVFDIISK